MRFDDTARVNVLVSLSELEEQLLKIDSIEERGRVLKEGMVAGLDQVINSLKGLDKYSLQAQAYREKALLTFDGMSNHDETLKEIFNYYEFILQAHISLELGLGLGRDIMLGKMVLSKHLDMYLAMENVFRLVGDKTTSAKYGTIMSFYSDIEVILSDLLLNIEEYYTVGEDSERIRQEYRTLPTNRLNNKEEI